MAKNGITQKRPVLTKIKNTQHRRFLRDNPKKHAILWTKTQDCTMNKQFEMPLDLPNLTVRDFVRTITQHGPKIKFRTVKDPQWAIRRNIYEIRGLFSVQQFNLIAVPELQIYTLHMDTQTMRHDKFFLKPGESRQLYELMARLYTERQTPKNKIRG